MKKEVQQPIFMPMEVSYISSKEYGSMIGNVEYMGRICYQSEAGDLAKALTFIKSLIKRGHESVLEHEAISIAVIIARDIAMEIIRHRIGAYSMESTRYVNYTHKPMRFIIPNFGSDFTGLLKESNTRTFHEYVGLINKGFKPEEARSILPNNLGAELGFTYNLRQWRHFLKQRSAKVSHPEIRELAKTILEKFIEEFPVFFEDLAYLMED